MTKTTKVAIAAIVILLLVLSLVAYLYSSTEVRANKAAWCYKEYRAVDQLIEDCINSGNSTLATCLSLWPQKTFVAEHGGCP